jgi:hypothetical protein
MARDPVTATKTVIVIAFSPFPRRTPHLNARLPPLIVAIPATLAQ